MKITLEMAREVMSDVQQEHRAWYVRLTPEQRAEVDVKMAELYASIHEGFKKEPQNLEDHP